MKLLAISLSFFTLMMAAEIQVVDQSSGNGLAGVNITIVGTSEGMNTDLEGHFTLSPRYTGQALKFSYIGYRDTTLTYAVLRQVSTVEMVPDVLDFSEIEVVSSKLEWEQTDLPSIVTVLRTRDLIDQGNVEIKEVLQRDPSVVVDESPTGVHEISIRGSNANEVMIVYDGIPLNSSYGGGFDLSWLDLNDIETISIIKGSGTLRYGAGAFGGVVVIDPLQYGRSGFSINGQKTDRGLRSFSISDILQLSALRTRVTYSQREHLPFGYYNDEIVAQRGFLNVMTSYVLPDTSNRISLNHVNISELVEPNYLYQEEYKDRYTQLKYSGDIGFLPNMMLQMMDREKVSSQTNHTDPAFFFDDEAVEKTELAVIENKWVTGSFVNFLRLEYKRDNYSSLSEIWNINWDHLDEHDIDLDQNWLAATDIFKYRTALEIPFVDFMELNTSYRYDVIDLTKAHQIARDGSQYFEQRSDDKARQSSRRSGFTFNKTRKNLKYQFFYSSGTSLRYPTLRDFYLKEINTIVAYMDIPLRPELNSSAEVGTQISFQPGNKTSRLDRIDIQGSLFRNTYIDKIYYRQIPRALPTPINFNGTTKLNGFEASIGSAWWKDRFRLFAGTSRLDITSFTIFPNKPTFKDVVELELNGQRGNLRLQYFHEGPQSYTGTADNVNYLVIALPSRENVNLYCSLKQNLGGKKYILGLSALNLISAENEPSFLEQRKWVVNLGISL